MQLDAFILLQLISLIGDIYGNRASGVYFIIILRRSAYRDIDIDNRSILYYLGPGSLENTNLKYIKEMKNTIMLKTLAKKSQAIYIICRINKAKKTYLNTKFYYNRLGKVIV